MNERKIEDCVMEELALDEQKVALSFIGFLRAHHFDFIKGSGYWENKIYYLVKLNQECICFISIKNPDEKQNHWTVWSDDMGAEWIADVQLQNDLKQIAWQNVDFCAACGACGGGRPKTIIGKAFDGVCSYTFRFDNPGEHELPFMKKMAEIRKNEILHNQ